MLTAADGDFSEKGLSVCSRDCERSRRDAERKTFESFEDADRRVGARLEVYAAGAYLWIPLAHVEAIETEAPKRLRDLLWVPALVRTGPAFKGTELGEVLLPVLAPFSAKRSDDNIRLGRATEWARWTGRRCRSDKGSSTSMARKFRF